MISRLFRCQVRGSATSLGRNPFGACRSYAAAFFTSCFFVAVVVTVPVEAQTKKVRVAVPGYTIAVLSLLAAKMNGYYTAEGLDVELIAMRAPTPF